MKFNKLIFLASSTILLACNGNKNETTAAASSKLVADTLVSQVVTLNIEQLKNANLSFGFLQTKAMHKVIKVNGLIDVPPSNIVSVSIPMGGYLKKTSLIPGMLVKKGNLLAVMEDPSYIELQQDYLTAKSKLVYLEADFIRQRDLNTTKAVSDKVLQLAKSDFESQKYLVKSLSEKLKLLGLDPLVLNENNISRAINFNAPINGYVTKVNVNIGKYVSPTDVLFELINPTDIHLALKIFEKDIAQLFIGQKLFAFTNNQPNKKHPCEILLIGKDISTERSIDVHCHFEDYDKTLVPGTYMNAEIQTKNSKSYVLPTDAIVRFDNKEYAFTQEKVNEFKMVELVTGTTEKGFTEIQNSEKLISRKFVLKGAYSLLMSLKNKTEE